MVLRLTTAPQIESLKVDEERFIAFLKVSFAQKRKTLLNNLKLRFDAPAVAAALKRAGVRPDARAEAIALDKMAAIFRNLSG